MLDGRPRISRRRFLSGMGVVGLTPMCSGLDPLAWFQPARRFTGDDFEEAHRLLMNPDEVLAGARIEAEPGLFDVIIVGGGISGLAAAYWLRDDDVLLLEREHESGGVAKSESWNGLEYALGAAYIIDPDPNAEDTHERRGFELLKELDLRTEGEDLATDRNRRRRIGGDANHCVFTNGRVLAPAEVYSQRNRRFFEHVLDSDQYPSIPPINETLVQQLDSISFEQFLQDLEVQRKIYGRTVGPLSAFGREAIEYYFWGAFGTTAAETSAYHGLNFFAAEFGGILIYPGGNAFIAKRLTEGIARRKPRMVRTGAWVLRVEPSPDPQGYAVLAYEQGRVRRYHARAVIFASPLFLAPTIVRSLPDDQRRAIATLDYRSYVVANVLLGRRVDRIFQLRGFRNGYELTRVHGPEARGQSAEQISRKKVFSDAVVADFPVWRHADKAVLTVYRPHPYASGRVELTSRTYAEVEDDVRAAVFEAFSRHGLRAADIEDIRISRWGHPMIVARPGQLADGTMERAARPQPGLFFAHTDVQGAPAYENALAAAMDAVDAVRRRPASRA